MMPSSITRFVDANSNAMAAVKSAPFWKIERAIATAAYEHDDDAAPSPDATRIVRGDASGRSLAISRLETTAWTLRSCGVHISLMYARTSAMSPAESLSRKAGIRGASGGAMAWRIASVISSPPSRTTCTSSHSA